MTEETSKSLNDAMTSPSGSSSNSQQQSIMSPSKSLNLIKPARLFKVIVIGDSNVGKTCLTFRFCGGKFLEKSEATIGVDFREKEFEIEDERVKLQIWDTAGQERFRKSMISHYYRNVHAIIFVYDVTNPSSFENLIFWIDECNRNVQSDSVPRILVGNKCDLTDTYAVPTNIAQKFADMHQMPLFETSARDDSNHDHVESIFMTVALKLKNSKQLIIPREAQRNGASTKVEVNRSTRNDQDVGGCFC